MLFFSFLLILLTSDDGEVSSWSLEVTKCCVNHTIAAKLQLDACKCSRQWANSEEALVLLLFFVQFLFFRAFILNGVLMISETWERSGESSNEGWITHKRRPAQVHPT